MKVLISLMIIVYIVRFFFVVAGIGLTAILTRMYQKKDMKEEHKTDYEEEKNDTQSHSKTYMRIKFFIEGYSRYIILWVGKIPSHTIRNILYKNFFCVDMGNRSVIYGGAEIRQPERLTIGEGSIVGDDVKLDARNRIVIGKNVNFSTGVWIWTEQHDINSPVFGPSKKEKKEVIIEDRVWLGSRVTVLPGVTVGKGAVVAAGAVVTKDCEPYGIYAGIPAKKIGTRSHDINYEFTGEHYSFW